MVSLRAPRELERYVFSPGGRSDSLVVQAGGEDGLPEETGWEGPEEGAPCGEDADVAKAIINDSGGNEGEQKSFGLTSLQTHVEPTAVQKQRWF